jgi:NTE family protein
MATLPSDVTVHVLPAGANGRTDLSQLRYRDFSRIDEYIDRARVASTTYLADAATAATQLAQPPGLHG